jgi:hypothetical protein
MAKIVRYNGNLQAFASAAPGTERTIFGDITQADDLTSQINADFLRGWGIVGPSDQPTLEDFNAVGYTLGQLLAYLHQMGIAEYNATQEYHLGSQAVVGGIVYTSLINTNVGNTPASSPNQWFNPNAGGIIVLSTTQVWNVPLFMQLGLVKPKVTAIGGGGGGGGVQTTATGAGGGGGGGGGSKKVVDLTGVPTVSATIGAGGVQGSAGTAYLGLTGGTTSFGAFLSAAGGLGGQGLGGPFATTTVFSGGGGGLGSSGDINIRGSGGSDGTVSSPTAGAACFGGNGGGPAFLGGGVDGGNGAGNNGTSPGEGGSGGATTNSAVAGGNGAPGTIIIEW